MLQRDCGGGARKRSESSRNVSKNGAIAIVRYEGSNSPSDGDSSVRCTFVDGRLRPVGKTEWAVKPRRTEIDPGCVKSPVDRCRWDESATSYHLMSLSERKLDVGHGSASSRRRSAAKGCIVPASVSENASMPYPRNSGVPFSSCALQPSQTSTIPTWIRFTCPLTKEEL